MADTPKDKTTNKAKLQHLQKYNKIKQLRGTKRNGGGWGLDWLGLASRIGGFLDWFADLIKDILLQVLSTQLCGNISMRMVSGLC